MNTEFSSVIKGAALRRWDTECPEDPTAEKQPPDPPPEENSACPHVFLQPPRCGHGPYRRAAVVVTVS